MTEREKMLQGMWYDANYDEGLLEERLQAEELYFAYNQTGPRETERKEQLLQALFPNMEKEVVILSPIYTDYGYNCRIGDVTILPGVTIGSNTVIGAGSVVTKDIPSGVVAAGNPCRVMREITQADATEYGMR